MEFYRELIACIGFFGAIVALLSALSIHLLSKVIANISKTETEEMTMSCYLIENVQKTLSTFIVIGLLMIFASLRTLNIL